MRTGYAGEKATLLAMPAEIGMHLKMKLAIYTYYISRIEL
jgi:hypothetical protein